MKMIRRSAILLVLVLFSTPLLSGQDLSSYRKFSLGDKPRRRFPSRWAKTRFVRI